MNQCHSTAGMIFTKLDIRWDLTMIAYTERRPVQSFFSTAPFAVLYTGTVMFFAPLRIRQPLPTCHEPSIRPTSTHRLRSSCTVDDILISHQRFGIAIISQDGFVEGVRRQSAVSQTFQMRVSTRIGVEYVRTFSSQGSVTNQTLISFTIKRLADPYY